MNPMVVAALVAAAIHIIILLGVPPYPWDSPAAYSNLFGYAAIAVWLVVANHFRQAR